jgi:putative nucleotidyltransferase with HDIG domain
MKTEKIDFHEFIKSIADVLEIRDFYTRGHSNRVAEYAELCSKEIGLKKDEIEFVQMAAHLHDIGKVGIPDSILKKEEKLTEEEYKIIKKHSELGYRILKNINGFDRFAVVVKHHHERWDGNGYPDNLKGEEIPLISRILSVADAFDAITSNRVYRSGLSLEIGVSELLKNSWLQFDGDVVNAFIKGINNGKICIKEKKESKDLSYIS